MGVPKITHQIWLQGWAARPPKFEENIQALHDLNPNWEHMKWDNKTLNAEVQKLGAAAVARFNSFEKLIQKVDFGRYTVLHNYGGVSVDLDMKPLRSLDKTPGLATAEFMVSESVTPALIHFNNAIIFTRPGAPQMAKILTTIVSQNYSCADFYYSNYVCTYMVTGPMFLSRVLDGVDGVHVLNKRYFEPCYNDVRNIVGCRPGPDAIMDHYHEGSWVSPWMKDFVKGVAVFYVWLPVLFLFMGFWKFYGKRALKFEAVGGVKQH
jgi:mannosyltransferase OCH1-like enzyme